MFKRYQKELIALALLLILGSIFFLYKRATTAAIPVPPVLSWRPFAPVPSEIVRGDTTEKQVIFTFDGGAGARSAETILSVLRKHGVRGTFFLTGKFVQANPAIVKEMIADGDEIFNHTYDHPYLTQTPAGHIAWELDAMDETIPGSSHRPYFRPPYGDRDARVLAAAAADGYRSVYWTVDAGDWEEPSGMTAVQVEDKILSNVAPGDIYLMHIDDTITGAILDDVFTKIEAQGYKIVSLTQGL